MDVRNNLNLISYLSEVQREFLKATGEEIRNVGDKNIENIVPKLIVYAGKDKLPHFEKNRGFFYRALTIDLFGRTQDYKIEPNSKVVKSLKRLENLARSFDLSGISKEEYNENKDICNRLSSITNAIIALVQKKKEAQYVDKSVIRKQFESISSLSLELPKYTKKESSKDSEAVSSSSSGEDSEGLVKEHLIEKTKEDASSENDESGSVVTERESNERFLKDFKKYMDTDTKSGTVVHNGSKNGSKESVPDSGSKERSKEDLLKALQESMSKNAESKTVVNNGSKYEVNNAHNGTSNGVSHQKNGLNSSKQVNRNEEKKVQSSSESSVEQEDEERPRVQEKEQSTSSSGCTEESSSSEEDLLLEPMNALHNTQGKVAEKYRVREQKLNTLLDRFRVEIVNEKQRNLIETIRKMLQDRASLVKAALKGEWEVIKSHSTWAYQDWETVRKNPKQHFLPFMQRNNVWKSVDTKIRALIKTLQ